MAVLKKWPPRTSRFHESLRVLRCNLHPAFIFLSKADLITGTTFVQIIFAQFGLEVHLGCTTNTPNWATKTEAMNVLTCPFKTYNRNRRRIDLRKI
jgi:hypothetical protein